MSSITKASLAPLPSGFAYANVTFKRRCGKEETRLEVIDVKRESGLRYSQEPMKTTAFKCFLIFFLWAPIYFFSYMALHILRLPVSLLYHRSLSCLISDIKTLVKAPFYWIAVEAVSLYGLLSPFSAKVYLSKLEISLHEKNGKEAMFYCDDLKEGDQKVCSELFSVKSERVFFLAPCMLPYGSRKDPHITNEVLLD